MSMFGTGEVPIELSAMSRFWSKLQLNELFNWFWASINNVIMQVYVNYFILIPSSCFINGQGLYWGFFVHDHDLIVIATRGGMRLS